MHSCGQMAVHAAMSSFAAADLCLHRGSCLGGQAPALVLVVNAHVAQQLTHAILGHHGTRQAGGLLQVRGGACRHRT